jgi:hypothetical protein
MAGYIGNSPTPVPLTSADLADSIITSAKIADGTIVVLTLMLYASGAGNGTNDFSSVNGAIFR